MSCRIYQILLAWAWSDDEGGKRDQYYFRGSSILFQPIRGRVSTIGKLRIKDAWQDCPNWWRTIHALETWETTRIFHVIPPYLFASSKHDYSRNNHFLLVAGIKCTVGHNKLRNETNSTPTLRCIIFNNKPQSESQSSSWAVPQTNAHPQLQHSMNHHQKRDQHRTIATASKLRPYPCLCRNCITCSPRPTPMISRPSYPGMITTTDKHLSSKTVSSFLSASFPSTLIAHWAPSRGSWTTTALCVWRMMMSITSWRKARRNQGLWSIVMSEASSNDTIRRCCMRFADRRAMIPRSSWTICATRWTLWRMNALLLGRSSRTSRRRCNRGLKSRRGNNSSSN